MPDDFQATDATRNSTGERIRSFVERAERLNEEITALNEDKSELFKEAKGQGFDVKTLKRIIQLRKQDVNERKESDALLETYMHAMGMI